MIPPCAVTDISFKMRLTFVNVTGKDQPRLTGIVFILGEESVQETSCALVYVGFRLTLGRPKYIMFRESILELEVREFSVDLRTRPALVAGVFSILLAPVLSLRRRIVTTMSFSQTA